MDALYQAIREAETVAMFLHIRPDGDTVGSGLGLAAALKKAGKRVDVYCDDTVGDKFSYLSGYDAINKPELASYGVLIAVDCSDEYRMGGYAETFLKAKNTVCIDHHRSNTRFAKYCLVDGNSASTAEIIKKVIENLGIELDGAIAECLYTGISTDTGNFRHSNTTAETFYAAYELMKYGIDIKKITSRLYDNSPPERTRLLGRALTNLRFYEDNRVSVMTVLLSDMADCKADASNTEGFIDFGIGIRGVEVAVCLLQHAENSFKVSFRSSGKADVCAIAAVFGGGGHTLASGCQLTGNYYDVVDRLMKAVRDELGA